MANDISGLTDFKTFDDNYADNHGTERKEDIALIAYGFRVVESGIQEVNPSKISNISSGCPSCEKE